MLRVHFLTEICTLFFGSVTEIEMIKYLSYFFSKDWNKQQYFRLATQNLGITNAVIVNTKPHQSALHLKVCYLY